MTDPIADPETPRTDASALEDWAGRYLDLFQRNWTAWLESTPAMIRAALATAETADPDRADTTAEVHDISDDERPA